MKSLLVRRRVPVEIDRVELMGLELLTDEGGECAIARVGPCCCHFLGLASRRDVAAVLFVGWRGYQRMPVARRRGRAA